MTVLRNLPLCRGRRKPDEDAGAAARSGLRGHACGRSPGGRHDSRGGIEFHGLSLRDGVGGGFR